MTSPSRRTIASGRATWQDVVAVGLRLPEAEESTTYHQPALKVRGRTFRMAEPA
jgi:hypothetical protein